MKLVAVLAIFFASSFSLFGSRCLSPLPKTCSFYRSCLEAKHPCGPNGYALGYGEKYCLRFSSAPMSPKGRSWMEATKMCLQHSLIPTYQAAEVLCEVIVNLAFHSHAACYTQPEHSVCDLGVRDLYAIYRVIDNTDLLSQHGLAQIRTVADICLEHLDLLNAADYAFDPTAAGDIAARMQIWHDVRNATDNK